MSRERSTSRGRNVDRGRSRSQGRNQPRDKEEYSHYSRRPKSVSPKKKEAPKSSLQALGDFMQALGGVAKMGRKNGSDSSSGDEETDADDDDDDDDVSESSDDSSLPTLPEKIKILGAKSDVHDELTVNSYALSLAEKMRDREETRRKPAVESREDHDTYAQYYTCS